MKLKLNDGKKSLVKCISVFIVDMLFLIDCLSFGCWILIVIVCLFFNIVWCICVNDVVVMGSGLNVSNSVSGAWLLNLFFIIFSIVLCGDGVILFCSLFNCCVYVFGMLLVVDANCLVLTYSFSFASYIACNCFVFLLCVLFLFCYVLCFVSL